MTDDRGETYATRGAQMFLRFTDEEMARLASFGEPRSYKAGDMLARTGGDEFCILASAACWWRDTARRSLRRPAHFWPSVTCTFAGLRPRHLAICCLLLTVIPARCRGISIASHARSNGPRRVNWGR